MLVSPVAIAGMLFTMLISIGVPVGAVLWLRRKTGHAVRSALVGLLCFVVFALVLEPLLHAVMLPLVKNISWLYVVYGCLAAGLFEETGRLVGLKILCKRNPRVSTGAAYGIGHGGGEAILIAGISAIANLTFVLTYSANSTSVVMQQTADLMRSTQAYYFWISGIERISAMLMHFALSILIWMVVTKRLRFRWYFAAIGMHALTNVSAAMMQIGILTSILWVEVIVFVTAAACCVLVGVLYFRTRANAPVLPPEEKPLKDDPLFPENACVQPTISTAAPEAAVSEMQTQQQTQTTPDATPAQQEATKE